MPDDPELIACRKLFAALPDLLDAGSMARLRDWLDQRQVFLDGQEDPGAVPTDGLDEELAVANTFRALFEALPR